MNMSKLARVVGLCLMLSITALTAFADPPPPQPCSCEYCSHANSNRSCINFDGTTLTCGYFLAVTFCTPTGG
jgi:hypothetical protein